LRIFNRENTLFDQEYDKFDYNNKITKYVIKDFKRMSRTSNFSLQDSMTRNILSFNSEPKSTIINMFSTWPFKLNDYDIIAIRHDNKPKRFAKRNQMVEYAVNCLMELGDWNIMMV
jgi:hypothetical protein